MFAAIEQVYPVEVAPNNISVPLHPYQKQSLAFMLYREKDAPEAACGKGRYTKYPLAFDKDEGELCATYDNTFVEPLRAAPHASLP